MTSFKTPTDFRKSLEARIKGIANKQNQDLQRLRRKVAFERLLARIFHDESNNFVLKGAPEWLPLYENLATECNLSRSMQDAYNKLQEFFRTHVLS